MVITYITLTFPSQNLSPPPQLTSPSHPQLASSTYLIDAYNSHAASVTAASTVFRSFLGTLLPLAGRSMYAALGVGWGTSVLAFISVALLPLPFVFYVCGRRIREGGGFGVDI